MRNYLPAISDAIVCYLVGYTATLSGITLKLRRAALAAVARQPG